MKRTSIGPFWRREKLPTSLPMRSILFRMPKLCAIASRDAARGTAFAGKFSVPKYTIRIKTWLRTRRWTLSTSRRPSLSLCPNPAVSESQKAVLCEKPLTMSHQNASEMVSLARSTGIFLMEGMWSRFFPSTLKTLELIRAGHIGEIRFLRADFGFAENDAVQDVG